MIDVISAFFDFHWVRYVLLAVYVMSVVGITVVIISENRNPVKSLAWVTVLFLLPAVGLILYLFFGRNIRNTRKISLRFRRRLSRCKAPHTSDYTSLGLSSESLQQITLGANLTDAQLYIVNAAEVFTNGTDKFAGNFHSNLEVFKVQNAFLHDWSRIAVARITVRFCKLFNNIVNCSFADTVFFFQLLFQLCGNLFFFLNKRKNFFCNFVVFRVNPSVIKRI